MKRTAPALLFAALVLFAQHLSAQLTTTVQSGNKGSGSKYLGNDLWFCIPQNLSGGQKQGQFYHVYVASDKNTIVNFQVQGQPAIKKPLTKNKVVDFTAYPPPQTGDFNIGASLNSSGQVETDKAIHVWSDNADLSVYLLARAPFSTDGMYVVPVTGWGTEYVVASYTGVDDFSGGGPDEWPSEFTIVANQDGTNVTITPAWDIRQNGQPKVTAHPKGQPFQVTLNKGECVQYQTIVDQNNQNYDLTGTYIKSQKPIGVVGASGGPYIPAPWVNPGSSDQSCCGDLVMDMMQPVRTWSNSYFTVPFANRPYSGDLFLVVGTKKNQVILRNGIQATILDSNSAGISPWKFQFLMDIHEASLWTSTDPFMLVQYMEGDWWDELGLKRPQPPKKQAGDPCDVVINANSQFSKKIIFQTPVIPPASQEADFQNFINLIVQHDHVAKTTFDGIPLTTPLNIPNISKAVTFANIGGSGWDGIQLSYKTGLGEGTHIVQSDTGVGVYIYGQANDESYAWSGALGIRSVNDPDTVPPKVIASGSCFCGHVAITDPLPGSKLQSVDADSTSNMMFQPDTNFIPGNDTSYYDVCVIDSTQPAYLSITIYDIAGNMTTVLTKYQPYSIIFKPNPLNFAKVLTSATEYLYDTVINNGSITINSSALRIGGSHGFSLDSMGANGSLAPGQMRIVKIKFTAPNSQIAADTLTLNSDCLNFSLHLLANNVPDYSAADFNFGCIDTGTTKTVPAIVLTNLYGGINITIDSLYIEDTKHFSDTIQYPFALASQRTLVFSYTATAIENDTTIVHFISHVIGERTAKLIGCGQAKAGIGEKNYSSSLPSGSSEYSLIASQLDGGSEIAILPPVPNPVAEKIPVRFVFGLSHESSLDLSLYDILGNHAASILREANHPAGIYELGFPAASDLPAGMYFYRLAALGKVISGKLVIGK